MISLIQLRKNKSTNQSELADLLQISRQTYSLIEKGKKELTLGQAVKLADFFEINVQDLFPDTIDTKTECPQTTDINREKYSQIIKNLIHYGADKDGKITKTKLAKLCYLLDFTRYYQNLESLTGLNYRKLRQGPVADAYFSALENLEAEESIALENKGRAHLISNISPIRDNLIASAELELLKTIAHKRKLADTQEIVDFTHQQMPWMMCQDMEIIPYSFITQEDPDHVY